MPLFQTNYVVHVASSGTDGDDGSSGNYCSNDHIQAHPDIGFKKAVLETWQSAITSMSLALYETGFFLKGMLFSVDLRT